MIFVIDEGDVSDFDMSWNVSKETSNNIKSGAKKIIYKPYLITKHLDKHQPAT